MRKARRKEEMRTHVEHRLRLRRVYCAGAGCEARRRRSGSAAVHPVLLSAGPNVRVLCHTRPAPLAKQEEASGADEAEQCEAADDAPNNGPDIALLGRRSAAVLLAIVCTVRVT